MANEWQNFGCLCIKIGRQVHDARVISKIIRLDAGMYVYIRLFKLNIKTALENSNFGA